MDYRNRKDTLLGYGIFDQGGDSILAILAITAVGISSTWALACAVRGIRLIVNQNVQTGSTRLEANPNLNTYSSSEANASSRQEQTQKYSLEAQGWTLRHNDYTGEDEYHREVRGVGETRQV